MTNDEVSGMKGSYRFEFFWTLSKYTAIEGCEENNSAEIPFKDGIPFIFS